MPDWETISSTGWVLVDFYAPWCAPCKQQQIVLEQFLTEGSKVPVVKMNIDDNRYLSQKLGVRNIPTMILYYAGEEKHRFQGLQSLQMLSNYMKTVAF